LAGSVMAEGSETPNGEQGPGPEGRPRRNEGDLLSERRARRAAESGEAALMRRAEAAEATVQTLERHVASLQQRLREAEDDRLRIDELLEVERAAALEREHELRRVKQREYAEQQLRVEAEERMLSVDRESRVEIERLEVRLSASELDARELGRRIEDLQRQLAEAEQEVAAERATVRRAEQGLQVRLTELERQVLEIQRGLDAERSARERSERLLERMREGHRRLEALLGEMNGIVARVTAALAGGGRTALARQSPPTSAPETRGAEMADALAAAVERLRARAEAAPPVGEGPVEPADAPVAQAEPSAPEDLAPPARQTAAQGPRVVFREPVARPSVHKHSLSWFARRRIKRKQRRGQ
jgi:chromosome segregation ATPase